MLGLARRLGCAHAGSAEQGVEEGRLADIGLADEAECERLKLRVTDRGASILCMLAVVVPLVPGIVLDILLDHGLALEVGPVDLFPHARLPLCEFLRVGLDRSWGLQETRVGGLECGEESGTRAVGNMGAEPGAALAVEE